MNNEILFQRFAVVANPLQSN